MNGEVLVALLKKKIYFVHVRWYAGWVLMSIPGNSCVYYGILSAVIYCPLVWQCGVTNTLMLHQVLIIQPLRMLTQHSHIFLRAKYFLYSIDTSRVFGWRLRELLFGRTLGGRQGVTLIRVIRSSYELPNACFCKCEMPVQHVQPYVIDVKVLGQLSFCSNWNPITWYNTMDLIRGIYFWTGL